MKRYHVVYFYRWRWERLEIVPALRSYAGIFIEALPVGWLTLDQLQKHPNWEGLEAKQ